MATFTPSVFLLEEANPNPTAHTKHFPQMSCPEHTLTWPVSQCEQGPGPSSLSKKDHSTPLILGNHGGGGGRVAGLNGKTDV